MGTYSIGDLQGTITGPGGTVTIGNGAALEEGGIDAEYTEDKNSMHIGADGEVMNVLNKGMGGRIIVRLLKTSSVNALLGAMFNFQRSSSANWGTNVITLVDVVRGDFISGKVAAFKKGAALGYTKAGKNNEWEFDVGKLHIIYGAGVPDVNI